MKSWEDYKEYVKNIDPAAYKDIEETKKLADILTDKQSEVLLTLAVDKFAARKNMGEVNKTATEIKNLAKKSS